MQSSIFDYANYKHYLLDLISSHPKKGRGIRSKLAHAVGCQIAYISQILNGPVHFTIEQAGKVNRFFGHSREESHFFLLLVQFERAGDQETRYYFRGQLDESITQRKSLTRRLKLVQGISQEDQSTYYSAWYFAAVHILLTIPEFRTRQSVADYLGLDLDKVTEILDFLTRTGLVVQVGDHYEVGQAKIHLNQESGLIARHHANWRIKALHSLDQRQDSAFHYSGVVSLSEKDVVRIKSILVRETEALIELVKASKEEKLCAICIDFFNV